jgi:hypothetical protein
MARNFGKARALLPGSPAFSPRRSQAAGKPISCYDVATMGLPITLIDGEAGKELAAVAKNIPNLVAV